MRATSLKSTRATTAMASFVLAASLLSRTSHAVDCLTTRGKPAYTTCRVARGESLRLFYADAQGSRVLATDDYRERTPAFATQSGPMLLHRGQIPATTAFGESSHSKRIRNGVCVSGKDQATFVISEDEVTFREFALYFREVLGCSEALYLDGAISSLFAPQLGRADARAPLSPMVAVVE